LTNFTRAARTPGGRLAISALAAAVVVFVGIGVAVELVFLPKASSSSSTATVASGATSSIYCSTPSSSCPTPSTTVQAAVTQWVADFNSRNVQGLGNFYSQDALVVWSGDASGLAGTYNGQGNVRILYGSSIGKTTSLNASISNPVVTPLSPDEANVTLTLNMKGNSTVVGALAITVQANQLWNYVSGQWQIVKEGWDYTYFYEQTPVTSTTFPQWTALKEGENPNLVSEKSFEWHAGPYIAASVYAFLFGVLAFGVIRIRERVRS
jgi:hypothetical protein